MQAVVVEGFGDGTVCQVPEPSVAKDELKVAVDRVQLSVTECSLYLGNEIMGADIVRTRLDRGDGRLFGHEFCGTVVEAGSDTSVEVGTRVYAPDKVACGSCAFCAAGVERYCLEMETLGTHRPGALAEFVAAPESVFRPLPDAVSDGEGAALQPLSDVLLSVYEVGIQPGDSVAVVGTGVMGYHCGQAALLQSAGEVLAVDIEPEKLELAADRGMTPVDGTDDPVAAVRAATDGRGADIVFEAVGGAQDHATEGTDPLAQAFQMVRPGGTIVQTGIIDGTVQFEPRRFRAKSVRWHNPSIGMTRFSPGTDIGALAPELVASGRLDVESYITHELSGLEQFERAMEITTERDRHGALGPAQLVL